MCSHFIPSPRRWMIRPSSSSDHFDCFFAGDWRSVLEACRLAPMVGRRVDGAEPVPTVVGALEGIEAAERDTGAGEAEDLERESSSSFDLRSCEISTLVCVKVFGGEYMTSKVGCAYTGLSICARLEESFAYERTGGLSMLDLRLAITMMVAFGKMCLER